MENNINKRYKSFTSLEQSKKLSEILPLESADMCYIQDLLAGCKYGEYKPYIGNLFPAYGQDKIKCWSLAALLDILPSGKALIHDKSSRGYKCVCANLDTIFFSNPVDACIELILKLKEQNLL